MKRQFVYIVVLFLFTSVVGVSDSFAKHKVKPQYKRVVLVRPVKPKVYVNKHIYLRTGYVWVDGHWKYNKRTRNYVWVKGYTVKKKKGKVWNSGHWRKVRGGWIHSPGFWA